ncbi:unnamed protein product [Rhizophagus irregularis]|nr:unnamed protein product [Rhizophagus irregularis]CAB4417004.1 unnamed protein product [Rhizophagus irregularis]
MLTHIFVCFRFTNPTLDKREDDRTCILYIVINNESFLLFDLEKTSFIEVYKAGTYLKYPKHGFFFICNMLEWNI